MTIENFIYLLDNPQVYSGKEINIIRKKPGSTKIDLCLVFPDQYEIGMSHYGLKILYHMLNGFDDVRAERCFLPEPRSIQIFKNRNIPLFSIENRLALKQFDLLGISLLSELNFTNVLEILQLAHVPIQAKHRLDMYPLVAGGGISSCNPEPLRDYFDFFAFGDGEALYPDILQVLRDQKKVPKTKSSLLRKLAEIPGLYIPSLHPLEKVNRFYLPRSERKIRKQTVKNLDQPYQYKNPIVPITNVVFNRLNIEIARGCLQNCRFCQAKSYYSPYRAAPLEGIIQSIQTGQRESGFETFSLSSLSSGDYPNIDELLRLIPKIITPCTSFSVPSMRPSTLSSELLQTLALFRRTGITIVPEAGSERLRRVINKNVSDEEIFQAVELAIRYNWQKIKLYFMIGLPGEKEKDIQSIVDLITHIIRLAKGKGKKIDLHTSFSSFVPKPHTPLQWCQRESLRSLQVKIDFLKNKLKKYKFVDLDFHNPQKGVVETILARGDARVGELIFQAQQRGQIFTAWDKHFNYPTWRELIDQLKMWEFLDEIDPAQKLPWDILEINFTKEHLLAEYRKSRLEETTASCLRLNCSDCRGCILPTGRIIATTCEAPRPHLEGSDTKSYNKTRIFYQKLGDFRLLSHLSMIKYIERLIRKSGISFRSTEGFHPRMKIAFLPPLPVFATGLQEVAELYVQDDLSASEIVEKLNNVSEDFQFSSVKLTSHTPTLAKDLKWVRYQFTPEGQSVDWKAAQNVIEENESIVFEDGGNISITVDFGSHGQERFARIYRMLDPKRERTRYLSRMSITFKSDIDGVNR